MSRLDGKVAVITGAGSGLGRESALLFGQEGATVVLVEYNKDRLDAAEKLVRDTGAPCRGVLADVRNEGEVEHAVDTAVAEFGQLDVMFANAGIRGRRQGAITVDEATDQDIEDVFETNFVGVFYCVKHAVRQMRAAGGGAIVVTSSAAALRAYPRTFLYAASKGALNALVHAVALDEGRYGIRINALCPTHGMSPNFLLPKDAPVVGQSYEETQEGWDPETSPIPLRIGRPPGLRDNANMALFLASDESAFLSGACLTSTDGGTIAKVAMDFGDQGADSTPKYAWFEAGTDS